MKANGMALIHDAARGLGTARLCLLLPATQEILA